MAETERNGFTDRVFALQDEARVALVELQHIIVSWSGAALRKVQEAERLSEAKHIAEINRAEVVQEAVLSGRINGKNAEERERQTSLYLDHLSISNPYTQAIGPLRIAQAALDQAAIGEAIESERLSAAKLRCRLVEAQLNALANI